MAYHLAEIVSWVHSGHPGAIVASIPGVPTGSYPLTNEVLLAWAMGLTRSFTPVALWSAAALALLLGAGWLGLRRLGVPRGGGRARPWPPSSSPPTSPPSSTRR